MLAERNKIKAGNIHYLTRKAVEEGNHIVIHKGGTGSGKTYDIMIYLFITYCMQNPNAIVTVVSESKPHLDIGCIRYAKQFHRNLELEETVKFNETRAFYTFPNNSILEFFSADRIGKALGARRNVLFGNEINHINLDIWDELARRSDIVIADFNPTWQFWLEGWLEYQENYKVILSNYFDNEYLSETERRKIELRAGKDPNFKRVHIDCEYGTSEGLIFQKYNIVDELPDADRVAYGLDFGFSNDPTALIRIATRGDDLYLDEVIYQTELTNREIVQLLKQNGLKPHYDEIIADSAEPKSIHEIRQAGFNIKPAVKGPDSIRAGIDRMLSFNIHITKQSTNLIKEFRNYTWVKDKEGKATGKPVDMYNHGIDAVRYAIQTKTAKNFVL